MSSLDSEAFDAVTAKTMRYQSRLRQRRHEP